MFVKQNRVAGLIKSLMSPKRNSLYKVGDVNEEFKSVKHPNDNYKHTFFIILISSLNIFPQPTDQHIEFADSESVRRLAKEGGEGEEIMCNTKSSLLDYELD